MECRGVLFRYIIEQRRKSQLHSKFLALVAIPLTGSFLLITTSAFTRANPAASNPSAGLSVSQQRIRTEELHAIYQYNRLHHVRYGTSTSPSAASIARQNAYVVHFKKESQTPQFQEQLTRQWQAQHQTSRVVNLQ